MIWENIKMAWNSLRSNKMRALLTMLGIIIGIGSVIAIVTVGNSLSSSISTSMQSMGANNITVGLTQKSQTETGSGGMVFDMSRGRTTYSAGDYITDAMLEDVEENFGEDITAFSLEESAGNGTVSNEGNTVSVSVTGVNEDYFTANEVTLLAGRGFLEQDYSEGKRVALISDLAVETLFASDNEAALGSTLGGTVNNQYETYTIIGVYEYEESGMSFSSDANVTTTLYIPLETAKAQNHSEDGYTSLTIVTGAGSDSSALAEELETFLNRYYHNNENYEISAYSMESMVSTMMETLDTVELAISAVAAISLLVGGIGVMNIMMVSISERTREIGTRKALGASNGSIRIQFIIEAVIICLIGGFLGVCVGTGLGSAGASLLGYAASPTLSSIVFSLLFSMAIGVFFGYYPANKAAKMNPIDALRYE